MYSIGTRGHVHAPPKVHEEGVQLPTEPLYLESGWWIFYNCWGNTSIVESIHVYSDIIIGPSLNCSYQASHILFSIERVYRLLYTAV